MKYLVGLFTIIVLSVCIFLITMLQYPVGTVKSVDDTRYHSDITTSVPPPAITMKRSSKSANDFVEEFSVVEDLEFDDILEEETSMGAPEDNMPYSFEEQLRTANFGFTINDTANIEDYLIAKFTIGTTKTIEEIEKELENIGIMVTDSIEISKLVMVDIKAPDFEVTHISPTKQPIRQNGSTNWKWKLKPKSEGEFPVELTVFAQVKIDGVEQSTFNNSYDKEVLISITGKQKVERWWENNWEWAWSTLIIPIGLYFRDKIFKLFKKDSQN